MQNDHEKISRTFQENVKYDFLNLEKGDYVTVPFGSKKVTGIVWNNFEKTEKKFRIKKVEKKLHVPKMKKTMIEFLNWFSFTMWSYYFNNGILLLMFNESFCMQVICKNYNPYKKVQVTVRRAMYTLDCFDHLNLELRLAERGITNTIS